MTPCQIGMNGFVGLLETPAPCSMIDVSWSTVRLGARFWSAGTLGETPPSPRSPWHCAQANWTKACAPNATCGSTGAGGCDDAGGDVAGVGEALSFPPARIQPMPPPMNPTTRSAITPTIRTSFQGKSLLPRFATSALSIDACRPGEPTTPTRRSRIRSACDGSAALYDRTVGAGPDAERSTRA